MYQESCGRLMFSPLQQIPLFAFAPKSICRSKAPPKHMEIGKRNILFDQNMVEEKKNISSKTTRNGQISHKMHFSVKMDRGKRKYLWSKMRGGRQKGNIFQKLRNLKEENVTLENIFCLTEFFFASKAKVSWKPGILQNYIFCALFGFVLKRLLHYLSYNHQLKASSTLKLGSWNSNTKLRNHFLIISKLIYV